MIGPGAIDPGAAGALAAALLGGGIASAITAFVKAPVERTQIVVTYQGEVIDDLREENVRLRGRVRECERQIADLREHIDHTRR